MSFAGIYRRYHQGLYRYCLAILGNREDAQDALQNTMIKAMRALEGEKRQIKLKPWLYRIAHNESIDMLRKRHPTEEVDVELAAVGPGAAETAETRERLRQLIDDLGELPDRQRGALAMRELSGLSFEQIGAVFDTSAAVARQTIYEARLGLREMGEGRDTPCTEVCRVLSDGDGRIVRRRDIRAHLRACPACRAFRDDIAGRQRDFAVLAPLPAVAAAGLLRGILGAGSASGAGLAGSVGAGAGKAVATSAIAKSAATVAVVAAVGAGAADRGGLVDVPLLPSGNSEKQQGAQPASATEPASPAAARRGSAAGEAARKQVDGKAKPVSKQAGSPRATAAPKATSDTGATRGHGPPDGLPAASDHGQQTANAHRPAPGQAKGHGGQSRSKGKSKASPSPHVKSKARGPRAHTKVKPDKAAAIPLYPANSTTQGASGESAP